MQAAALTRASVCQGKIFKSYLTHNIIAIDFVESLISCEMRMKLHHSHYRSHCAAMPSHGIHRFHRWTHTAKHGNGNSSVPPNIFTSYITSLSLLLKTENNGRPLPAKKNHQTWKYCCWGVVPSVLHNIAVKKSHSINQWFWTPPKCLIMLVWSTRQWYFREAENQYIYIYSYRINTLRYPPVIKHG